MLSSKPFFTAGIILCAVALSACNQQSAEKTATTPTQTQPAPPASAPQISAVEQPTTPSQSEFTAYGNQGASWRIVARGDKLEVYIADMAEDTIPVVMTATDKGANFSGKLKDKDILVQIAKQSCTDDNKQTVEFMAMVDYGDKHFMGCAVAGAINVAPT